MRRLAHHSRQFLSAAQAQGDALALLCSNHRLSGVVRGDTDLLRNRLNREDEPEKQNLRKNAFIPLVR